MALPSETASGLSEPGHAGGSFPRPDVHERLGRVLSQYKPTLVLACYGINDGIYLPLDSARTQAFRQGMISLRQACLQAGAKIILITPPLYAPDKPKDFINYDGVLDNYAQWLVDQRAASWQVIDIRPKLRDAIAGAKKEAPKFIYSKDNIHPGPEGHVFIAQAVWSQLAPMMKWKLDTPFADGAKFKLLQQSMTVLRDAWLKQTGYLRPGLPSGMPLEQAEARSTGYLREYFK
jgi:lysophospholipase L1-like esterase